MMGDMTVETIAVDTVMIEEMIEDMIEDMIEVDVIEGPEAAVLGKSPFYP